MGITIDFTGVETREFEPLPAGRHLSKVSACEHVPESKRSGEPSIAWQFTVDGGEFDGRKSFLNTSLQPQSLWNTKRVLLALGWSEEELEGELDFEPDDALDRPCVIVIGHEMYEGAKRQRVRRVLSAEGFEVDTAPF